MRLTVPRLLFLLALLALLPRTARAAQPGWRIQRHGPFVIHTQPGTEALDPQVLSQFDDQYVQVHGLLGLTPDRPLPVYLYHDRPSFLRDTQTSGRERVVGIASSNGGVIRLDATGLFAPPGEVLRHELTHAFLFLGLGNRASEVPLWFNEGLAQHAARPAPWEVQETLDLAVAEGRLVALDRLRDQFPEELRAVAYAQSQSVVEFLLARMKPGGLHRLLSDVKRGAPFPRALKTATGLTIAEAERRWSEHLGHSYRWAWVEWLAWPGVGVAFILAAWLAFAAVRRKRERVIRDDWWPAGVDEEIEEPD